MTQLAKVWARCPLLLKAVLSAFLVGLAGSLPWAVLAALNTRVGTLFPWSVPVMAGYLWFYWQYLQGRGWPQSTAETRHRNLRAGRISGRVWGWSLLAGSLALVSLTAFNSLAQRLVPVAQAPFPDLSHYSVLTILAFILMGAAVAGISEEAAFRGYLQAPLERRYGPLVAILLVGLLFGFWHFDHAGVSIIDLPYYLAVSAIYGILAHLTDSILPALVLHACGNALLDLLAWWRGPAPALLPVWQSGIDLSFALNLAAALLVGFAAILVYKKLAQVTRVDGRPLGGGA